MKIEMSVDDKEFVIHLLQQTSLQRIVERFQSLSTAHPDNEDFIELKLTISEIEELIGELSYEANHNRKKRIATHACEIAESLESQLWYKKSQVVTLYFGAQLTNKLGWV